jgi:hypothetical protein
MSTFYDDSFKKCAIVENILPLEALSDHLSDLAPIFRSTATVE